MTTSKGMTQTLENKQGQAYWQSLDAYAQTPEFQARIAEEFPSQADAPIDGVTRRNFLQVMGASMALAGVTAGCARQPAEMILPYVKAPEDILPGEPLYFATSFVLGGYAEGILAESNMGRPVKVEGHPGHPASLGGTSAMAQASLLGLYDPDRSKSYSHIGNPATWDAFVSEGRGKLDTLRAQQGAGVRILTETVTSPTLAGLIENFLAAHPKAVWHQYEPVTRDNVREGARLAFGEILDTRYAFDTADVVVSLDSDFLGTGPGHVRYARDFSSRRDVVDHHGDGEHHALSRMYAIESSPSITGATADNRISVKPSEVAAIAQSIAAKMDVNGVSAPVDGLSGVHEQWAEEIANDLKAHRGKGIVVVGTHQPASVHALAHAINHAAGNVGQTVFHIASAEARPTMQGASLRSLVEDMNAGDVEFLLIFDGNPVYNAPVFDGGEDGADLRFADALDKVATRVHVSPYDDETSELCHWQIPLLHDLEAWGDAKAFDGTVSIVQPLIAPFYDGKAATEVLSALMDETERTSHEILMDHWKASRPVSNFDTFWASSLSNGMIDGTASVGKTVRLTGNFGTAPALGSDGYEINFLPDPMIYDGRFSNNAWLQEVPKPLTKITWDNVVTMSAHTAQAIGVGLEDLVEVAVGGRSVRGAAWIQPGHADGTLTLHLGYGRTRVGQVAVGMGFDANTIRGAATPTMVGGATVSKVAGKYPLATTEEHYNIEMHLEAEKRALIREYTQAEYDAAPEIVHHAAHDFGEDYTLYDNEEKFWPGNKWGMTIDLNKCTGCSACIVACQSENNIPVVGKAEVRRGREMHWIRVDRYYRGDISDPKTNFQPLPCMQCENATCEVVCPVGATQHTQEGLNDMVYNRCIGTRYCSNNCPYKVRRFNFYHYARTPFGTQGERALPKVQGAHHVYPEAIKAMFNPEVTVRTRGVMEKCTYCVQRINAARIDAKKQGIEQVPNGAVQTACEQACPSAAITFGNMNADHSTVAELKESHRNYTILADVNTRPRTSYLARLTNPNETLSPPSADAHVGAETHEA